MHWGPGNIIEEPLLLRLYPGEKGKKHGDCLPRGNALFIRGPNNSVRKSINAAPAIYARKYYHKYRLQRLIRTFMWESNGARFRIKVARIDDRFRPKYRTPTYQYGHSYECSYQVPVIICVPLKGPAYHKCGGMLFPTSGLPPPAPREDVRYPPGV
jgi:hypothetical protein